MKKICKWYKTLPKPQRSKALNNLSYLLSQRKSPDLVDALYEGFSWTTSNEGLDYWVNFKNSLNEKD